jgi:hypothetical protein
MVATTKVPGSIPRAARAAARGMRSTTRGTPSGITTMRGDRPSGAAAASDTHAILSAFRRRRRSKGHREEGPAPSE